MSRKYAASRVGGNASRPSWIFPSRIYPSRIFPSRIYLSRNYPIWIFPSQNFPSPNYPSRGTQGMSVGRMLWWLGQTNERSVECFDGRVDQMKSWHTKWRKINYKGNSIRMSWPVVGNKCFEGVFGNPQQLKTSKGDFDAPQKIKKYKGRI